MATLGWCLLGAGLFVWAGEPGVQRRTRGDCSPATALSARSGPSASRAGRKIDRSCGWRVARRPGRGAGRASASNGVDLEGEAASRSLEVALEVARSSSRVHLKGEAAPRSRSRSRVF